MCEAVDQLIPSDSWVGLEVGTGKDSLEMAADLLETFPEEGGILLKPRGRGLGSKEDVLATEKDPW